MVAQLSIEYGLLVAYGTLAGSSIGAYASELFTPFFRSASQSKVMLPPLLPVIAQDAHVRVAHASSPAEMILRRPYSYDNGMRDGTNDVGLLFAAFQAAGKPAELFVYDGQGHMFQGQGWADMMARTGDFFDAHVK